jgi:hypothetical protein
VPNTFTSMLRNEIHYPNDNASASSDLLQGLLESTGDTQLMAQQSLQAISANG